MKKEIRTVDKDKQVVQVTVADERWYIRESTNEATGLPEYEYVPSVTWITSFYPKGIGFENWLKKQGDEAEQIKTLAGEKGSKIHQAVNMLCEGKEVGMDTPVINTTTGNEEEMTAEEYSAVLSFASWFKETQPKIISSEFVVFGQGYAGTVDLLAEINGKLTLIDVKTGQNVYPSHVLQVSAYAKTLDKPCNLAILQLGYRRNKKGYKYSEVENQYSLFLAAKEIWANETKGTTPWKRELPLKIKL